MRLFIAEKPTLGRAIAEGLGGGTKKDGYISINNNEDVVTWCFGHILKAYMPEDYDEKYKQWKIEDLPIVPSKWKLRVKKEAKKQYAIIKDLIGSADFIVNAGDPDAVSIISNLKSLGYDDIRKAAENADPTIHSRAWNDANIQKIRYVQFEHILFL